MQRKGIEAPVFFTSASRVKIPFVGDDTTKVKAFKTNYFPVSNPLQRHHNKVANHFIKSVSGDVNFDIDVVRERSSHLVPFQDVDFETLFDAPDVIKKETSKEESYSGRFDTRGYNRKIPGHLKKLHYPTVSIHKKSKQKLLALKQSNETKSKSSQATESNDIFITEVLDSDRSVADSEVDDVLYLSKLPPGLKRRRRRHPVPVNDWDELILDKLSKDTARWIVFEHFASGKQKEKLGKFVKKKFGEKISNTHLVREEVSESDLDVIAQKRKEANKKDKELDKMKIREESRKQIENNEELQQTVAQYYKLPRYLKQQRSKVISTSNEVNQTAQSIKVKHLRPSPPPKMQDFLNPNAGKYINTTENEFEQQLYTGQAKPVHQTDSDNSRIIMNDHSEYQNKLQQKFPPEPHEWSAKEQKGLQKHRLRRGLQRWSSLPEPADFMSERGLNPPVSEKTKLEDIEINHRDQMLDNMSVITIIEEWRSKWRIAGRWQEVKLADIMFDMENIHAHVRLAAVTVCAMAALHKVPVTDIVLAVFPRMGALSAKSSTKGHLPETLVEKVKERLNDKMGRVRLAAAMCLYTLGNEDHSEQVNDILQHNMIHGNSVDQLASAQCLALNGCSSATVIHVLLDLLLGYDQSSTSPLVQNQHEQATQLLVHISENTSLVHSLLAEQLNSSNWKDRAVSCNVLSKLAGNINRDLVHKLTNLMWHDWSSGVRKAAAQALGKTGHGREVHFQLRDKLLNGNERVRVNVLKVIAHLEIMTASLLPAFMKCYQDEYISVRLETCLTTAKLKISDEKILTELIRLMQYDPVWKIKAHAIKAIGQIGLINDKAHDALVWAIRFEDEPGVRMEACAAIRILLQPDTVKKDVIRVLQDRVLVEPDPGVKEEVRLTLDAFGMSGPEDNMEMIQQIKNEVKRLCDKGIIASKITMFENELEKYQNKAHYVGSLKGSRSSSRRVSSHNTEIMNIPSQSIPSTAQTAKPDYTPRTQTQSQVRIVLPSGSSSDSMDTSSYISELNMSTTPFDTPMNSMPNTPNKTKRKSPSKHMAASSPNVASLRFSDMALKAKSSNF